jgi:hypothetical protein
MVVKDIWMTVMLATIAAVVRGFRTLCHSVRKGAVLQNKKTLTTFVIV